MKTFSFLAAILLAPSLFAADLARSVLPGSSFGPDWEVSQASPFANAISPSYINRKLPGQPVVIVNVIEFASPDAARQQWTGKFGTPEASQFVRKVEGVPDAFDTIPQPEAKDRPHLKRFMLIGRYWLTVEQIGSKDYREDFIQKYHTTVKKLAGQDGGGRPAPAEESKSDGAAGTRRFDKYGFSVQPPKGWHVADAKIATMFATANHQGVVAHAKVTSPTTEASQVESDLLMILTKHPLGANEDNPTVTLSVEKSWKPAPQNTGATYLNLLAERYQLFRAPSQMQDAPRKIDVGGAVFFTQDAVNNKVPGAPTAQQYYATYMNGHYVTFILSYNEKTDSDYLAMQAMVESFKSLK